MNSTAPSVAQQVSNLLANVTDIAEVTDAALRDELVDCEQAAQMLMARQATAMAEMARRAEHADRLDEQRLGRPLWSSECRTEFVADEIAVTLTCTKAVAARRYGIACDAVHLPSLMTAWSSGRLDERKVSVIADGVRDVDPVFANSLAQAAVEYASTRTTTQVRAWLARRVIAADPGAAEIRHQRVVADRRVMLTPLPDGVSELTALLPSIQARQIYDTVNAVAHEAGAEDVRTMDQRRADALFDLLVGRAEPPQVHVQVVVPVDTLLGEGAEPGVVPGLGPITASEARELASGGCGSPATWRRLLVDDTSGVLLDTRRAPVPSFTPSGTLRSERATSPAGSLAADAQLSASAPAPTSTTPSPGRKAPPKPRTWRCCAAIITGSNTPPAGVSSISPPESWSGQRLSGEDSPPSRGPTSIRPRPKALAASSYSSRSTSSACSRSSGYGEVNRTCSPEDGWAKASSRAWSHWRDRPRPRRERRVGPVGQVPHTRMSDGAHVHPDLMRASRLQVDEEQTRRTERLERLVVRHALFATGGNRPAPVILGVPPDRCVDGASARVGVSLDHGVVDLLDGSLLERSFQHAVGAFRLGHNHHAARTDVEPVHDALALGRPARGDSVAGGGKTPDDGRPAPPRARVCGHSDWLVHDDDVVVVVQDEQARHRLGVDRDWRCGVRKLDLEHRACMNTVALEGRSAVDEHRTSADQVSRLGSRQPEEPRHGSVDALALKALGDGDTAMFWHLVRLARRAGSRSVETDPAERQPHHQDRRTEDRAVCDVEHRPVGDGDPVDDRPTERPQGCGTVGPSSCPAPHRGDRRARQPRHWTPTGTPSG